MLKAAITSLNTKAKRVRLQSNTPPKTSRSELYVAYQASRLELEVINAVPSCCTQRRQKLVRSHHT